MARYDADEPMEMRILFISANPEDGGGRLRIDEEVRAIENELRSAPNRDRITFHTRWASRITDLLPCLSEERPHIVHFSSHGTPGGDLILIGDDGRAEAVPPESLRALFRAFRDTVQVVVFNACYSLPQATAVAEELSFAVGIPARIKDEAAVAFSKNFYSGLAEHLSVPRAYEQAIADLTLRRVPTKDHPVLIERRVTEPAAAPLYPESYDVTVPVGPMPVDRERMKRTEGIKIAADVGTGLVLDRLLEHFAPISDRIHRIHLLMGGPANSRAAEKVAELVATPRPQLAELARKLIVQYGLGGDSTPITTLCTIANTLTPQIIVNYCDVWTPPDAGFYKGFLKSLPATHEAYNSRSFGGTLACCSQPPLNFLSPRNDEIPATSHCIAGIVQYPFHVVEVQTYGNASIRLANMAIAAISREVVNTILERELQGTELFNGIREKLIGEYYFRVYAYHGEWYHCDTDRDVDVIRQMS